MVANMTGIDQRVIKSCSKEQILIHKWNMGIAQLILVGHDCLCHMYVIDGLKLLWKPLTFQTCPIMQISCQFVPTHIVLASVSSLFLDASWTVCLALRPTCIILDCLTWCSTCLLGSNWMVLTTLCWPRVTWWDNGMKNSVQSWQHEGVQFIPFNIKRGGAVHLVLRMYTSWVPFPIGSPSLFIPSNFPGANPYAIGAGLNPVSDNYIYHLNHNLLIVLWTPSKTMPHVPTMALHGTVVYTSVTILVVKSPSLIFVRNDCTFVHALTCSILVPLAGKASLQLLDLARWRGFVVLTLIIVPISTTLALATTAKPPASPTQVSKASLCNVLSSLVSHSHHLVVSQVPIILWHIHPI